ncbi:MAG: hypothetical protein JRD04_13300 [Deltaproteobacteria bacterium]|nr:hypothetical protein [Deltaproteobacteria bacterium]
MNRGRRGESVFLDKLDYAMFVELLKEVVDMYKVRVAAYDSRLDDPSSQNLII